MILANAWNLLKVKFTINANIFIKRFSIARYKNIPFELFSSLTGFNTWEMCALYQFGKSWNFSHQHKFIYVNFHRSASPMTTDFCIHYSSHFFFLVSITFPCFYKFFKVTAYFPSFSHALSFCLPTWFSSFILVFDVCDLSQWFK